MKTIDSSMLVKMIRMGLINLSNNRELINKLNVFPVPDGDTGTNMNLSMTSGMKEVEKVDDQSLSIIITAFVKGLLMGARGNSGVILSQLFRGFSANITEQSELSCQDFALALENGVQTAYQSVTNPVEGTILTVAKDTAHFAKEQAKSENDIAIFMENIVQEAKKSLQRTPDLLPILKEVGVVDSGGQGLVAIYEGFLAALKGDELPELHEETSMETMVNLEHEKAVQSFIDIESIEYGYCTEFIIEFDKNKLENNPFDEAAFRNLLGEYGDSLLVASDESMVKVHIHAEQPGEVMTIAQQYGDLVEIDIENMRKQYKEIVKDENSREDIHKNATNYAVIAIAAGSGIKEMYYSIGATFIIDGGQTMNPSTEDILAAIHETNAKNVIILPNNKNIIMSANQAASLIDDKNVTVIPTKTIPQGIGALFEFDDSQSIEENEENMTGSIHDVKTGLVTFATRDTVINHLEVKEGSFIGLDDETIVATSNNKLDTTVQLMEQIVSEDDEIVTMFYGLDVSKEEVEQIEEKFSSTYEEIELEMHEGNQPIYSFIIMVE